MKSIAVAARASAIGGPTHAKPVPETAPFASTGPVAPDNVESNGASISVDPLPSVTAESEPASTAPVSASIAFPERNARFANAPMLEVDNDAIAAIEFGKGE